MSEEDEGEEEALINWPLFHIWSATWNFVETIIYTRDLSSSPPE